MVYTNDELNRNVSKQTLADRRKVIRDIIDTILKDSIIILFMRYLV